MNRIFVPSLQPGLVSMCEHLNIVQTYMSMLTCWDWQKCDPAPRPGTCPAYLKPHPTPSSSDVFTFLSLSTSPSFFLSSRVSSCTHSDLAAL